MTQPLRASAALDDLQHENVIYLGSSHAPAPRAMSFVRQPAAPAVLAWRNRAEVRMEAALAAFDLAMVAGEDPAEAAEEVVFGFMAWTRATASEFAAGHRDDDLSRGLRAEERVLWERLARIATQAAGEDPAGVDRFVKIWLSVLCEAIRTGNSPLYAAPAR